MCAATLAREGLPVVVLDAGGELGGRATTTRHEGFLINEGAHALYPSSEGLLKSAGVRVKGGHPRPDKGAVLRGGELHPAPLSPRGLIGSGPLSGGERARLLGTLASVGARGPGRLGEADAASWIAGRAPSQALADLLGGLLRLSTYCGELSALPAELGVGVLREALRRPVRYVDGGWREIVGGLAASAGAAGAALQPHSKVEELLADQGVRGVRLSDGSELRGCAVVLAGLSPSRAGRLLSGAGGTPPLQAPRPVRAACLDVALSELPRPGCPFALGLDEPLYLSVHTTWARLAPGRGAVVHLLRYDDGSELPDTATRERLEGLLDQAQPGWRERVVHQRFAPRMTVAHHLPSPAEGLRSRPRADQTGIDGVFLAGDWVGAEGWLAPAALLSGRAAAAAVALRLRSGARPGRAAAPVA
jgi:phytoene dehydrogenase-like protein